MRAVVWIVVLLASGCGRLAFDPLDDAGDDGAVAIPANVPSWTSGTRLRARLADFGGDATSLLGWYDSLLGANCDPGAGRRGTDGEQYCFPLGTNIVYGDASCTMPLGMWQITSGAPRPVWASDLEISAGQATNHVFRTGANSPLTNHYVGTSTACNGPYPTGANQLLARGGSAGVRPRRGRARGHWPHQGRWVARR